MKNKLGMGQEDRYDYGHSGGPRGVITVEVRNYQRHRQRQMPAHLTGLVGQPLPKLPTPFAAAQVPLPDDNDDLGGLMPLSRAGSIPLADARALAHLGEKVKDTSGKRGSVPLRQALMPGQAAVGGVSNRLGSAPPGIRPRPSFAPLPGAAALGLPGAGIAPRHQSAPHLGSTSVLCLLLEPLFLLIFVILANLVCTACTIACTHVVWTHTAATQAGVVTLNGIIPPETCCTGLPGLAECCHVLQMLEVYQSPSLQFWQRGLWCSVLSWQR